MADMTNRRHDPAGGINQLDGSTASGLYALLDHLSTQIVGAAHALVRYVPPLSILTRGSESIKVDVVPDTEQDCWPTK
mgnify:FL=1